MSRFEYLSAMVSIVIALGISEIASSWGRLLRARNRIRFSALHAFWSLFTVLLMVQFWWGFWEWRDVADWTFVGLLAVVAEALVLVLAAMVLVPGGEVTEPLDLRVHFFAQRRVFFTLGMLLIAQLTLIDRLVGGQPFLHLENAFRVPGVLLAGVAASTGSGRVHAVLAALASCLLGGFVVFAYTR